MLLFSKLNNFFFGYFDPDKFFFQIIKTNNIRGDLTDISAKKALVAYNEFIFKMK